MYTYINAYITLLLGLSLALAPFLLYFQHHNTACYVLFSITDYPCCTYIVIHAKLENRKQQRAVADCPLL